MASSKLEKSEVGGGPISASSVTSKVGVNFVRTVVESAGCLFIKVEQENDIGIDAILEIPTPERWLLVAAQIKSGASYCSDSRRRSFQIGRHRDYWTKHSLPVIGIVYEPRSKSAHWINVKKFLAKNVDAHSISFEASKANEFSGDTIHTLFVPALTRSAPTLTFSLSLEWSESPNLEEAYAGLASLFHEFRNERKTWDSLVSFFQRTPQDRIPPVLVYWLAHVPWHPDIASRGPTIEREIRNYAHQLLCNFSKADYLKLLALIDENSISRGSIGQSVEAVISSLPRSLQLLEEIALDRSISVWCREHAALIISMKRGESALEVLRQLRGESQLAVELIALINDGEWIDPY